MTTIVASLTCHIILIECSLFAHKNGLIAISAIRIPSSLAQPLLPFIDQLITNKLAPLSIGPRLGHTNSKLGNQADQKLGDI
ncbi:hypothetical protein VNO77_08158 [Canavalia gladiata]|uniref:Uncharacterized protein n=1 Tax=Canavalia gladiata TaxID=3824 RepID=A0AAN9M908_CANGL